MIAFNPTRRFILAATALLGSLVAMTLGAYVYFDGSRSAAAQAADDFADCQRLVVHIHSLQQKPTVAGEQEMQASELAQHMEAAAKAAAMPPTAIVRIAPSSPRRIGESVYKEEPTEILLEQVTLRQVLVFFYDLTGKTTNLSVSNLRLTAPRDSDAGDRWTVEATLSHVIYAPESRNAPAHL